MSDQSHAANDPAKLPKASYAAPNEAQGRSCRICNCHGFTGNPAEPTECIANNPVGYKCMHSYLNH